MAVTISTPVVNSNHTDSDVTGSVTIGASDSGLVILLGIGTNSSNASTDPAPTVTVGGVSATQLAHADGDPNFGKSDCYLFHIDEADLPSAGSQSYTVTWTSDNATASQSECYAIFIPHQGGDTPTEWALHTSNAGNPDPTAAVDALDGDVVVAVGTLNSNSGNRRVDWLSDDTNDMDVHLHGGPDYSYNSVRAQGYAATLDVSADDTVLNVTMDLIDGSIFARGMLAAVIPQGAGGGALSINTEPLEPVSLPLMTVTPGAVSTDLLPLSPVTLPDMTVTPGALTIEMSPLEPVTLPNVTVTPQEVSSSLTPLSPVSFELTTVSQGGASQTITLDPFTPVSLDNLTLTVGSVSIELDPLAPVVLTPLAASAGAFVNDALVPLTPVALPAMTVSAGAVTIQLDPLQPVTLTPVIVSGGEVAELGDDAPILVMWIATDVL
jgi:hypothetical protein